MTITEAKSQMRDEMRARRAAFGADASAAEAARRVAGHGLAGIAPAPGALVSGFHSFGDEIDTAPLLARLHADGHPLCLPVMAGRGMPLLFRRWVPGDALVAVQWGIREPAPSAPAVEPDIMLVPLLAFDASGHRLGYGGGFYDRTIAGLRQRKAVTTVGLAFDEQRVDAVPHLDYDQPLDWLLTPSGRHRAMRA